MIMNGGGENRSGFKEGLDESDSLLYNCMDNNDEEARNKKWRNANQVMNTSIKKIGRQ